MQCFDRQTFKKAGMSQVQHSLSVMNVKGPVCSWWSPLRLADSTSHESAHEMFLHEIFSSCCVRLVFLFLCFPVKQICLKMQKVGMGVLSCPVTKTACRNWSI